MATSINVLRFLFLVALSIWMGGFTFYGAVVIPVLHDRLGSPRESGLITQRVTVVLNAIGVATLLLGWILDRATLPIRDREGYGRRWWSVPLLASSMSLIALFLIHGVLDRKLETGRLAGFYPWHRAYLWTSTVQWLANLGLLAQWAGVVTRFRGSRP